MAAARQAGDRAGRDGAGNIEEASLEQLADHARRLGRAYLTGPDAPAVRGARHEPQPRLRAHGTHRAAVPRRDLYLVAGQLSCLLAGTSCDLRHSAAAIEQARAALTDAEPTQPFAR